MKKVEGSIFIFALILVLSFSLISAGWFSDIFNKDKGIINGFVTEENVSLFCQDSDGGKDSSVFGYTNTTSIYTPNGYIEEDNCNVGKTAVYEKYCENDIPLTEVLKCDNRCENGACIKLEPPANISLFCQDSDGGKDSYVFGYTNTTSIYTPNGYIEEDNCNVGKTAVYEKYCNGTEPSTVVLFCANGCDKGACSNKVHNKNIKNLDKYSNKEVFLVSDENWKQVLTLISLAIWTDDKNELVKYPLLIYHQEGEAFDIDSIYYFLEQYNVSKVSYFGTLPNELKNLLQTKFVLQQKGNPLDYWKEYKEVVYVEENYESALLASTYASLINAPLIIKGYNDKNNFYNKNIICIGQNIQNCSETYSLEELQKKYIEKTNTTKLILINPLDKDIFTHEDNFKPERSMQNIQNIYGYDSLTAPILASGKKELIITTLTNQYDLVDLKIENDIKRLGINPEYLTIIGSPDAIKNYKENIVNLSSLYSQYVDSEVDWVYYSDINHDELPDLALGRIYGITISDTSSYIARSLFIEFLPQFKEYAVLSEPSGLGMNIGAVSLNKYFKNKLNGLVNISEIVSLDISSDYIKNNLLNKMLISTHSHGSPSKAIINTYNLEGAYFVPSIYLADACLTCSYQHSVYKDKLLCTNLLRRGVMGTVGAIDSASSSISKFMFYVGKNQDLGTAMKNFKIDLYSKIKSIDKVRFSDEEYTAGLHESLKGNYILLGDPTFNLNLNFPLENNSITSEIESFSSNEKELRINIPKPIEVSEEYWVGQRFSRWIVPSYENVIVPYFIQGNYQNNTLTYQQVIGNIQIKTELINSSYFPNSVTYINEHGDRTTFNYLENYRGWHSVWYSPINDDHHIQIGILNNTFSIFLYQGNELSGEPILESSSYEIIFSENNVKKNGNGSFVEKKERGIICNNNYECKSNICASGECVKEGLIKMIVDTFQTFFKNKK